MNGVTCTGTTYCGTNCPTVNQVTCYTTCNAQTCTPSFDILYDTTDADGNYSFNGLDSANYIITPKDSIYIFIPENRTVTIINSNAIDINFSSLLNPPTSVIVVDGLKDDFYNTLTGPNDGYLQLRSYAFNDNGRPTSDADLSAKIWTAWDNEWFYLYEEVMDDTLSASATNVYDEDEIELKFDPQPTDSVTNSVWDTRLTALGPAEGVVASDSLNNVSDSQKLWVRRTIAGGYVLELAIKWSAIQSGSETITPAVDNIFGMAINQHDNDGYARREATVEWAAVLLDAVWNTPKYLGTVKFLAENKLQFIPSNTMTGITNPVPYDGSDYLTGIKNASPTTPETFNLRQNYPNPFNPTTTISFILPSKSFVSLKVFDLQGREVATIVSEELSVGTYKYQWNATNRTSGVYFYRLQTDSFTETKKLILLK
jgi:hypothetical protein